MVAILLTPFLRPAIPGLVPLALLDAAQPGSGKTLLTELLAAAALGRPAPITPPTHEEEEWRKRIFATLRAGAPLSVINNVRDPLDSSTLAAVLTARLWTDRVLGASQMLTLPHHTIWVATGNNIQVENDLSRRAYWIRLNAETAQPWQRGGFKHPQLLEWVGTHRGAIVTAALTVLRGWYTAGCPQAEAPVIGSFEAWCQMLGSVLAYAGISGFLGNLAQLQQQVDTESRQWETFLLAWVIKFGAKPVTVRDLATAIQESDALRETLPDALARALDGGVNSFRTQLGQALHQRIEHYYGDAGLYIQRAGEDRRNKVARWQVCGVTKVTGFPRATTPSTAPLPAEPSTDAPPASPSLSPTEGAAPSTLPSDLPPALEDWPRAVWEHYQEHAARLEVDGGLSRAEANQQAEATLRRQYAQAVSTPATPPAAPPQVPDPYQIAATVGVDLNALAAACGLEVPTLTRRAVLLKNIRSLSCTKDVWDRLNEGQRVALEVFLTDYIDTRTAPQAPAVSPEDAPPPPPDTTPCP